jgi:uncharacterized repeat protein (TIGR01451 family)
MNCKIMIGVILTIFLAVAVTAQDIDLNRQLRLEYGDVMRIDEVGTEPSQLAPGSEGILTVKIRNAGDTEIKDVRVTVTPPSGISFLDDVSKRKIATMASGGTQELSFNLIVSPAMAEGVYSSYISVDYLNKIGQEKQDNDTFAIIIKSQPKLFVKIDESEIYKGNGIGDVTVTFVNNDIADIKFLTVELQESENYDIVSTNKMYIGDLDSDDFESVDFTMRLLNEKDFITLPLKITYKDALNNDYSQDVNVDLRVRDASDLGNGGLSTTIIFIIIIAIIIVAWLIWRSIKKKKEHRR